MSNVYPNKHINSMTYGLYTILDGVQLVSINELLERSVIVTRIDLSSCASFEDYSIWMASDMV